MSSVNQVEQEGQDITAWSPKPVVWLFYKEFVRSTTVEKLAQTQEHMESQTHTHRHKSTWNHKHTHKSKWNHKHATRAQEHKSTWNSSKRTIARKAITSIWSTGFA